MHLKRVLSVLLFTLSLPLAAHAAAAPETPPTAPPETLAPKPPTAHDKVYYFQHRLLPRWTHQTQGAFFADLKRGVPEQLKKAAVDLMGEARAKEISIRLIPGPNAILIDLGKPLEPPESFCALIFEADKAYRFVTLEMTEDSLGMGFRSVVGEWTSEGKHLNHGPRKYADVESFLAEVVQRKESADKPATAAPK